MTATIALLRDSKADQTQKALRKYNNKWVGKAWDTTSTLYKLAVRGKTSHYGVRLQDHVLSLLGDPTSRQTKQHLCKAAQDWIDWMTK